MVKTDEKKNEFEQKIAELETKNEELNNNWKRALADYQNLEKRMIEDRHNTAKYSSQKIFQELIAVLDILEKAAEHLKDQGLQLAVDNFLKVLKENGVTKIEVLGKKFDPETMECIEVIANDKDTEVLEEVRPGYFVYDKVLRAAQVKVGKKVIL